RFVEVDLAVPVGHDGELLGALTIKKKRGEPITPPEHGLVQDLAAQAGLVLRNVGLTAELRQRLEELRDSRRRLVEAQDQERRRLERDLHDGAQQQLVALKLKLGLARRFAARDGASETEQLLDQLAAEADEAVRNLRELAHGIYPPLLAAEGLAGALRARAARSPIPVRVEAEGVGRFSQEVEAAVYFCVLEGIQNAVKYARAAQVIVRLREYDTQFTFEVTDDGAGFDATTTPRGHGLTNMADRLDALGGTLIVDSTPGHRTTIRGELPAARSAATRVTA
ncbi:MAG: sensor histidine kinase, partial [Nitriliruptorales bacterium]